MFFPMKQEKKPGTPYGRGLEGLRTGKLLDRRFFWMGVLEHHGGRNGASRNFKIWEDMGCKFHLNIYIKTSYHYIIQNMH
jgi:hypothetical protein